jgi:hypothetical protein
LRSITSILVGMLGRAAADTTIQEAGFRELALALDLNIMGHVDYST